MMPMGTRRAPVPSRRIHRGPYFRQPDPADPGLPDGVKGMGGRIQSCKRLQPSREDGHLVENTGTGEQQALDHVGRLRPPFRGEQRQHGGHQTARRSLPEPPPGALLFFVVKNALYALIT